ncbi:hypothetical protein VC116063_003367 [Vibrio cholerae O1 str. 116063]|nr:hypothetical protein VC116063_003367 [Vibrio cholerae O1 str. 116063]
MHYAKALLLFFYLPEIHLGIELSKKPTQRVGCVAKIGGVSYAVT